MKIAKFFAVTATTLAITLGSLSATAQTESISYTVPMPELDEFVFLQVFDFGDTFQIPIADIPKFDSSLGTLVDVEISFNYDVSMEIGIQGEGVIDEDLEHFVDWQLGQLAVGVTFTSTAVDPPTFNIIGEIDESVSFGCYGDAFQGFGCGEYDFLFYGGGTIGYSLANNILLSDFIGSGFYDGLFFEFDVLDSQFFLENIGDAFVDIYAYQDPANTSLTIEYFYTTAIVDADGDGIGDALDNCINVANAGQTDTDGDGYGNACDADVDNNCVVNIIDLGLLKAGFFGTNPVLDFNGDGLVNVIDLGIMKTAFFGTPGPSGPGGACDPARSDPSEQIMFQRDEATGRYLK